MIHQREVPAEVQNVLIAEKKEQVQRGAFSPRDLNRGDIGNCVGQKRAISCKTSQAGTSKIEATKRNGTELDKKYAKSRMEPNPAQLAVGRLCIRH